MKNQSFVTKTLLISAITAGITTLSIVNVHAEDAVSKEKCYGISKAGKNDCASGKNSCAGSAKVDNQGDAFVIVPKGLCEKITGGSTTAK